MGTNPPMDWDERPLPRSEEAEQSVLGAVLIEPTAIHDAAELRPQSFFASPHRKIFAVMLELEQQGIPIDLTTLVNQLQTKGWLNQVGGVTYLAQLANSVPTAANIGYYIAIIQEKHTQRQMIAAANELSESAFNTDDTSQTIAAAQTKLDSLIDTSSRKPIRKLRDILIDCFTDIEQKYASRDGTEITGIPSGYDDLDRITGGFQDTDLIVVGARPSVGKTAFALNISRNGAAETRKTIAIFSLEMSEKQLSNRMISAESHIDGNRIRSGHLAGEDWEKLTMAIGSLSEYPILIDDTPGITIYEIRAKCRKLKREHPDLGMIVIDYLQLIETIQRSGINRQQEITEISRSLKHMAKELNVPVIALSQLSRGVEQRQDKRPMLSDLRESGSIEQDADIVAFLYRDDYYDKESEKKNIIEIIIAKQRNGPVGTVELAFLKNYNKFVNLDRNYSKEPPQAEYGREFVLPDMYRHR